MEVAEFCQPLPHSAVLAIRRQSGDCTEGTTRNVPDTGADPLRRCALLQYEHVIRQ